MKPLSPRGIVRSRSARPRAVTPSVRGNKQTIQMDIYLLFVEIEGCTFDSISLEYLSRAEASASLLILRLGLSSQ